MRSASTYRSERRNDWKVRVVLDKALDDEPTPWAKHNAPPVGSDPWHIGSIQGSRTTMRSWVARSKYMPHIGAKERARHASQPSKDGGE
jgi:hypothetical protein